MELKNELDELLETLPDTRLSTEALQKLREGYEHLDPDAQAVVRKRLPAFSNYLKLLKSTVELGREIVRFIREIKQGVGTHPRIVELPTASKDPVPPQVAVGDPPKMP